MGLELGAAGQGAAEGLDKALQRIFLQQQLAEQQRHSKETESQGWENLRQQDNDREAQAEERRQQAASRKATTDAAFQKTLDERTRDDEENFQAEKLSNSSDPLDKKMGAFLRLRRLSPQGAIPSDLFKTGTENAPSTQQKPYKLTDPNLAKQFGMKVGDTIDADYTPGKGTGPASIKFRGVDVTNGVQHYEKPPTPDRVLIQSGNDYMTREDARKKLSAGQEVPLATTSTTRTMEEGAKMILPHIPKVRDMAVELDKRGWFGPLASRVRAGLTKFGTMDLLNSDDLDQQQKGIAQAGKILQDAITTDPQMSTDRLAGRFKTALGLMATGAGRVHGGARGGGSPQMLEHFKDLLSSMGSLNLFQGSMDEMEDFMKGYAGGPPTAGGSGGKQDDNDPLGILKPKPKV